MFSLSAKGVYGLTALLDLAAHRSRPSVQIRDIAERHSIPQHYLEQILVALKKAGYVTSFRGAQGGYALWQGFFFVVDGDDDLYADLPVRQRVVAA